MSLTLIIAPMFSGKTTYLLNKASICLDLNFSSVFVTHTLEDRDPEVFLHSTLLKPNLTNKLKVLKSSSLETIEHELNYYSNVFIDEFQFFTSLYDFTIIRRLINNGKNVYIAGLKGNAFNQKFGILIDLIPEADDVVILKSFCKVCSEESRICVPAPFTKRVTEDKNIVLVGAKEVYIPVCRKHY
jgi:thymidine kinase